MFYTFIGIPVVSWANFAYTMDNTTFTAITMLVIALTSYYSVDVELEQTSFAAITPIFTVTHSTMYSLLTIAYTAVVDVDSHIIGSLNSKLLFGFRFPYFNLNYSKLIIIINKV